MESEKKSFILYMDTQETWNTLSDEQAGKLIKNIYKYVRGEELTLDDPVIKIAFISIKQHLIRDLVKWKNATLQRKSAARASVESRKRKTAAYNDRLTTVTQTSTVNDNVNDSATESVNFYKEPDFIKNWKKCREHFLNKPTHFKNLNVNEKTLFKEALKEHNKDEINEAMQGLFKQKNIGFESMTLRPKHFLENVSKYYDAEKSKSYLLYGKKQESGAL
jgi:hypothetical protein